MGSDGGISATSEYQGGISLEGKRLEKKLRNLEYENGILKEQLKKEREAKGWKEKLSVAGLEA